MKVILLENVTGTGRKYDILNVASGFALNFLFPQKLAERATTAKITQMQKMIEELTIRKEEIIANAVSVAAKLEGKVFTTSGKASDKGHLYGSISASDIVDLIKKQAKVELDKEYIMLEKAIKEVGDHKVMIELTEKAKAEVIVKVEGTKE